MQEINQHIDQLKHLVSLRYIDPIMRNKCFAVLESRSQENCQMNVCHDYIVKIEQEHEKMMGEVSLFLNMLAPIVDDYSHSIQIVHQQIIEKSKMHELEVRQMNNQHSYLSQKIDTLTQQIHEKDEYVRELTVKIDEKDAYFQQRQKEDIQYMNRVQVDFTKLNKSLQEFLFAITKKDEQINILKEQIYLLQESKTDEQHSSQPISQEYKIVQQNKTESKKSQYKSDDSYQIVQRSFISSSHKNSQGLSQFQQIRMAEDDSRQANQEPFQRSQSIRQMLNLSYEKEFRLQYHKLQSSHENSKQNYYKGWNRYEKSKSDEKKPVWGINNSLQLVAMDQKRDPVKQFKLGGAQIIKQNNIYYIYFLIASQNVKIRSPHFQQFIKIDTEPEWQHLNKQRIPLHEWQMSIQSYLTQKSRQKRMVRIN